MIKILVVEDESVQRTMLSEALEEYGFLVESFAHAHPALERLNVSEFDILLTDYRMPDLSGLDLIKRAITIDPQISCVIITAFGTIETAVEAIKSGAYDYITKPIDIEALILLIKRAAQRKNLIKENRLLREQLHDRYSIDGIIGQSSRMQEIFSMVYRVAPTITTVLITGESGTGKELIARAIHANSPRTGSPFVPVNCAALPDTLLESELFGHEPGAFTGAGKGRMGKFETAHGGTLFLDEIGDISPAVQVKLLRFLQEKTLERLGSNTSVLVDVRLIAATNRDLNQAMNSGRFREDLYWRLNVVTINLPSLRERRIDLPILLDHFIHTYAMENDKRIDGYSREFFSAIQRYDFPGNVRELENIVERAVVMTRGDLLTVEDLPDYIKPVGSEPIHTEHGGTLPEIMENVERDLIQRALAETDHVQIRAAERLGISERVLRYKIKKYDLK